MDLNEKYGHRSGSSVMWNPWNKVVQDHRDGTVDHEATNYVRAALGLKVPWTIEVAREEGAKPVFLDGK